MKACIIHCGMHKTGTTSIQHSLFYYLNDANFYYIDMGSPNMSGKFLTMYKKDPERTLSNRLSGHNKKQAQVVKDRLKARLFQQLEYCGDRSAIISAESLTNLVAEELEELKQDIQRYTNNICVVAYIRDPISHINSSLQENIKAGATSLEISAALPRYQNVKRLLDVLSPSKRIVRHFSKPDLHKHDVVRDFCQQIGAKFDDNRVVETNESLSADALSLLYVMYSHQHFSVSSQHDMAQAKRLVQCLKDLDGPKYKLPAAWLAAHQQSLSSGMRVMNELVGEPLTDVDVYSTNTQQEYDLSNPSKEARTWLATQLGLPANTLLSAPPEEIGRVVKTLSDAVENNSQSPERAGALTKNVRLIDVMQKVESSVDNGLQNLTRPQAMKIVNQLMLQLREEVKGHDAIMLEGLHGGVAQIVFGDEGTTKTQRLSLKNK